MSRDFVRAARWRATADRQLQRARSGMRLGRDSESGSRNTSGIRDLELIRLRRIECCSSAEKERELEEVRS